MKNLVVLFVVFFSLVLVSCSDISDNSFPTSPAIEKSLVQGQDVHSTPPVYPYPYLFSFSEVKGIKFIASTEDATTLDCYMSDNQSKQVQLYVVVTYKNILLTKMFYINKIDANFFKVKGINLSQVEKISVYSLNNDNISNLTETPFSNNTELNEIAIGAWKPDNNKIVVEASGIWPSNLKYVFAELTTKQGNILVFLQRPFSSNFIIPEYGSLGVTGLKLLGYHTVMERELAQY
jgi:hypothetical protein